MEKYIHKSKYLYGHKISDCGLQYGFVDYETLANIGDMVLLGNSKYAYESTEIHSGYLYYYEHNETGEQIMENEYWELTEQEQEQYTEIPVDIYQWYLIDDNTAHELSHIAPTELILYNTDLEMYIWGINHWGTSWDYALTDIPIDQKVIQEYKAEQGKN